MMFSLLFKERNYGEYIYNKIYRGVQIDYVYRIMDSASSC